MKKPFGRIGLATAGGVLAFGLMAAPRVAAQGRLPNEVRSSIGGAFNLWRFAHPVAQDSLSVSRVSQIAIPVSAAFSAGRWTFDAGFAYASGRVELADGRTLDLSGATDVRLRAVGRVVGDNLLLTFGATLPTGRTRLVGSEIDAIRVLGSPALRLPVTNLGTGAAGTIGLVYATRAGDWNVGVGASFEGRGSYAPIESRVAGVSVPTDLHPGSTMRGSLGLDRTFARSRLSLLFAGEVFSHDRIEITTPGGVAVQSTYQLGPQFSAIGFLELGVGGFRSFTLSAADRYRTSFTGLDGRKAAGSNGNVFEAAVEGVSGMAGRTGLVFRVDGRLDSGLEIDNTITTAAMTAIGLTLGLSIPAGRATLQPFVRGQIGTLDVGPASTSATGFGGGLKLVFNR